MIESSGIDLNSKRTCESLENILTAHYYGNHFVYCKDIQLLSSLCDDQRLSGQARSSALEIKAHRTFHNSVFESGLAYLTVTGNGPSEPIKSKFGWSVNVDFFFDRSSTEKAAIVCENLSDVDLYHSAATHYMIKKKLMRILKIQLSGRSGGGNSTNKSYERAVNEGKKPVLCIVDSDKKHSKDSIKDTAKLALSTRNRYETNQVVVLKVRAAENSVPMGLLKRIFPIHAKLLDDNFKKTEPMPFAYANLKETTKYKQILELKKSNLEGFSEWTSWIKSSRYPTIHKECERLQECQNDECKCTLLPSFSSDCLKKVNKHLSTTSIHSSASECGDSMFDEWERIGKIFLEYCAASSQVRA